MTAEHLHTVLANLYGPRGSYREFALLLRRTWVSRLRWPPAGARLAPLAERPRDSAQKARVAEGLVLRERQPDVGNRVNFQFRTEQRPNSM
jgi:hypothetical protein